MLQRKDIILIIIIVIIAALSAALTALTRNSAGELLRITIDGELYGEYRLSESRTITIHQELGQNEIVIENNTAYMKEADCPDRYCMDYQPISRGNETIICLPHKLVAEVIGASDGQQPDVIVQ